MSLARRPHLATAIVGLVSLIASAQPAGAAGPFTDDDGNTHESSIELIHDEGITYGCGPSAYCPESPVTRGQMAAFLNRALELPAADTASGFLDTTGTFFDDIERLYAAGITVGCGVRRYCTNEPVSRGQMAAFLNRALDLPPAGRSPFADRAGTFADDIDRLFAAGITTGCAPDRYCGDRSVTRAEMATFLVRALGLETSTPGGPGTPGTPPTGSTCCGEGRAHVVVGANTAFGQWTQGDHWDLLRQRYDTIRVYEPYWDSRLESFDDVVVYRVAMGIAVDNPADTRATDHPDWVLRTAGGDPTYLDFGCSGGCPRYAADVGNPAFRADFVDYVRDLRDRGYKGLHLDDVNLLWRFSDRFGDDIEPIDPRTGDVLRLEDWQRYFAEFLEEVRDAVPDMTIVHNVIWYTDSPTFDNPHVTRQIAAADVLQLERGANDSGLTGNSGKFGLETFFAFIDRAHDLGTNVLLADRSGTTAAAMRYNLAATLLVNDGGDQVSTGNLDFIGPETFWDGFDTDLGDALGPRRKVNGVIRRDFTGGIVLLTVPDSPTRTVTLATPMIDSSGASVASVTLTSRTAEILRYP